MKVLNSLAVSGALTVAGNAVWHAGNLNPANYAAATHGHPKSQITDFPTSWAWSALTGIPAASTSVAGIVQLGTLSTQAAAGNHTHTGFATSAQGTKADNALPATSYTAADVLAKLLAVDTDTAGINATTVKSITPGAGGLVLLAQANLGSGWTTLIASAKPTTRAGWGITDAAANVHYHSMSDISDFQAGKSPEYFASPISGSVSVNVATHSGVIARINGNLALNFSGTIYGDYEIVIYNDSGATRYLDLNFYNSVINIKGSAGSTSITIQNGQMYRAKFHYIYAAGDAIMGVADVD